MSKATWITITCASESYGMCMLSMAFLVDTQPYAMRKLPIRHHMISAFSLHICKALCENLSLHSLPLALLLLAMLRDMRSCCRAQHADTGQADSCNAHPAIQDPLRWHITEGLPAICGEAAATEAPFSAGAFFTATTPGTGIAASACACSNSHPIPKLFQLLHVTVLVIMSTSHPPQSKSLHWLFYLSW